MLVCSYIGKGKAIQASLNEYFKITDGVVSLQYDREHLCKHS